MIEAKIIADSQYNNNRMTTFQVRMHRYMIPEITRHRILSFSVASNRAVPTPKIIQQVEIDPAFPISWGANQPGMVAGEELEANEEAWANAAGEMGYRAYKMWEAGYHKQICSRLLEPFQWCDLIISGTEWDNFFLLRLSDDAQPEIREVARQMKAAMDMNTPQQLSPGEWHLPYIYEEMPLETARKVSMARCARVSYLNHDQSYPSVVRDVNLAEKLISSWHWSPAEHQAIPMSYEYWSGSIVPSHILSQPGYTHMDSNYHLWSGNLKGFIQNRKLLDG